MNDPPPSYEDAVLGGGSTFAATAAAALVCDGPRYHARRCSEAGVEASGGFALDNEEDGEEGEALPQQQEEGDSGGEGGFWVSSSTRLGVNIGGSFIGLVGEEHEFGFKIGGVTVGVKTI
ncbi:uncharacterized protein LMH87_008844 [Akanthomyces muscarius]|uniref:Uncharacterized protein n=2 Tax=Akanthomyces TaxID=150366 RepID=A0A162N2T6_CORDF|nr:uncharacterized protein LMH87_008844 [Akanthomyces muscarius]KAJ4158312.1 hypothetical protein LMH87_008844 [Akanthomyces muscarius]OAA74609.1 hypothetical protein LEL_08190 [Akanthomyces lecanii RCEF 1005]